VKFTLGASLFGAAFGKDGEGLWFANGHNFVERAGRYLGGIERLRMGARALIWDPTKKWQAAALSVLNGFPEWRAGIQQAISHEERSAVGVRQGIELESIREMLGFNQLWSFRDCPLRASERALCELLVASACGKAWLEMRGPVWSDRHLLLVLFGSLLRSRRRQLIRSSVLALLRLAEIEGGTNRLRTGKRLLVCDFEESRLGGLVWKRPSLENGLLRKEGRMRYVLRRVLDEVRDVDVACLSRLYGIVPFGSFPWPLPSNIRVLPDRYWDCVGRQLELSINTQDYDSILVVSRSAGALSDVVDRGAGWDIAFVSDREKGSANVVWAWLRESEQDVGWDKNMKVN
jgi:hypothetical protein